MLPGWRLKQVRHHVTNLPYFALIRPDGHEIGLDPLVFQILHSKAPILNIDGGRSSAKSTSAAQALILEASGMAAQYPGAVKPPARSLVIRESVNSLKNSVMNSLWGWIEEFGMERDFVRTGNEIRHRYNRSEFVFRGLKSHTRTAVRSFVNFHRCWIEEGQEISLPVWEDLEPTIRRKDKIKWQAGF